MEEIPSKNTGDFLTADEFNEGINSELQNAVGQTGQSFSASDLTQLGQSMTRVGGSVIRYRDTGAVNAYVLTLEEAYFPVDSYVNGLTGYFIALNENTGTSTININALGAKNCVDFLGASLAAGAIAANSINFFTYSLTTDNIIVYQVNATDNEFRAVLAVNVDSATAGANEVGVYLDASATPTTSEAYFNALILASVKLTYIGTGSATAIVTEADFEITNSVNIDPTFVVASSPSLNRIAFTFDTALNILSTTNIPIATPEESAGENQAINTTITNFDQTTISVVIRGSDTNSRFASTFSLIIFGYPTAIATETDSEIS